MLETVEGRVSRDNKRKDDIQIINFIHKIRFFVISELYVKVLFLKITYKLFFVIFKNYFAEIFDHKVRKNRLRGVLHTAESKF